jgi:hypothetical protein
MRNLFTPRPQDNLEVQELRRRVEELEKRLAGKASRTPAERR